MSSGSTTNHPRSQLPATSSFDRVSCIGRIHSSAMTTIENRRCEIAGLVNLMRLQIISMDLPLNVQKWAELFLWGESTRMIIVSVSINGEVHRWRLRPKSPSPP
jgi:hypothetical protein